MNSPQHARKPRAKARSPIAPTWSSSAAVPPEFPPPSPPPATAPVTLLERYPYLGGLASGGMVLVLDDMHNGTEITVRRHLHRDHRAHAAPGACCVTPPDDRLEPGVRETDAMWRKWARWGLFDFHTHSKPHPVCYAAAFDPDGFKRASYEMVGEAGVKLRLHSWFSRPIVEDGGHQGRRSARPRRAARRSSATVVIDATGDLDVAASAGAAFVTQAPSSSPPSRASAASTPRRPSASSTRQPGGVRSPRPRGQAHHRRLRGTSGG